MSNCFVCGGRRKHSNSFKKRACKTCREKYPYSATVASKGGNYAGAPFSRVEAVKAAKIKHKREYGRE